MSVLSPNMSLVLPTIGVDSGLTWEQSVNTNSGVLDGHNHSVGSGVQINPSGININNDLPFNGFNATSLRSVRFNAQTSPISLPTDIGCIYVSGVDLYYNDVNANQIRITSGGTVNATSSGISDGTATAAFSSGTLVVDAASNTPANIQVASVLLGNTGVPGSDFVTLSPPNALSSNYSLVLPPLPAQTNVMTLDTSGNMNSITYDQVGSNMTSIGANAIGASMTSTGANAVANTRTRSTGTSVGVGGVAISATCGNFSFNSTTYVNVTNLSVTLTTSGRPVFLALISDGTVTGGVGACFLLSASTSVSPTFFCQFVNSTNSNSWQFEWIWFTSTQGIQATFSSSLTQIDTTVAGTPGTYTYIVQVKLNPGFSSSLNNTRLIAYEL